MVHFAIIAVLTGALQAPQRPLAHRMFTYDSAQIQAWDRANHVNQLQHSGTNSQAHPSYQGPTHVNVSGSFGGVFNVSGIGSATSQVSTNLISVNTNRPLTFTANSFKPLMVGNSSESVVGSIMYSMALYQGTPSRLGGLVSGPVTGIDSGFSGQVLSLANAQIPNDGNLVLVFTRTLNLNEKALGAYKLVGTGNIGVTIN